MTNTNIYAVTTLPLVVYPAAQIAGLLLGWPAAETLLGATLCYAGAVVTSMVTVYGDGGGV